MKENIKATDNDEETKNLNMTQRVFSKDKDRKAYVDRSIFLATHDLKGVMRHY